MKDLFFLAMLIVVGFGLSIQGSINGTLGKSTGAIQAAFFSFLVGTICLLILMLVMGKGSLAAVWQVPKWQWIGGILGAAYILTLTFTVPRIGIGLAIVAVIVGQLTMSMVIDHFGWFQSTPISINPERLVGIALLICGMVFIYKGS